VGSRIFAQIFIVFSLALQDRWQAFKERRLSKTAEKQPNPGQHEQQASKQGQIALPIEAGALQPHVAVSKQAAVSPSFTDIKGDGTQGPLNDKTAADDGDLFAGAIPPVLSVHHQFNLLCRVPAQTKTAGRTALPFAWLAAVCLARCYLPGSLLRAWPAAIFLVMWQILAVN
jgi:hypothetical protein